MTYKLIIPRWIPTTANQLLSRHPMTRSRLKRIDANLIAGYCSRDRIPAAIGIREVGLKITLGPKQRAADPDAYWKSVLDGLVKARMLVNDDRLYCRLGSVEFERGDERATMISLREIT